MDHASGFFFKAKRRRKGLEFLESLENSIALVVQPTESHHNDYEANETAERQASLKVFRV